MEKTMLVLKRERTFEVMVAGFGEEEKAQGYNTVIFLLDIF
jgi:hypothetical protein